MSRKLFINFLIFQTLLGVCMNTPVKSAHHRVKRQSGPGKVLMCYYTSWSQYRLFPQNVDANVCTHVIYATALVDSFGNINARGNDLMTYPTLINHLKSVNPQIKVYISVGGATTSSTLSDVFTTTNRRQNFVSNCVQFIRSNNFDGLDLNWEFPSNSNKQYMSIVLQDLRAAFDLAGSPRIDLVAALGAQQYLIQNIYDFPAIASSVDYMLLMTYDFHGGWSSVTGIHSALYQRTGEAHINLNQHWAVTECVSRQAPANQLVLGVPAYGRSFTLTSPALHNVSDPVSGQGYANRLGISGWLEYTEICLNLQGSWTSVMHAQHQTPYAYSIQPIDLNQWVGYEDPASAQVKSQYVLSNGLAGVFVWEMSQDDYNNECGQGSFPLLWSIRNGLSGSAPAPPPPPTTPPPPTSSCFVESPTTTCRYEHGPLHCHATDCTKFYQCVWGKPRLLSCPAGLHFDCCLNYCNWPSDTSYQQC